MQAIGYFIALPFIYLIALLPFPLLYLLSDGVFILLYYVTGYRKQVVYNNLKRSFPKKSEQEILILRKKFYKYFCDFLLETLKGLTLSKKTVTERCKMDPASIELMDSYFKKGQSVILVLGHQGNWEWGGHAFSAQCRHQLNVIYHPLENPYFNRLIIRLRTRLGTGLIEMKNTFKEMIRLKDAITATAFIADQTPPPDNAFWLTFLNQDTPVFKGTEVIARKLNYPVIFISIRRQKRGYYSMHAELLCSEPAGLPETELTLLHSRRLEQEIENLPEIWLWSHRRWKHTRPQGA